MVENMDEMIEVEKFRYYYPGPECASPRLTLTAMGIHERMAPGVIRHGGPGFGYLLMFFHSPATVWCDSEVCPAERGIIVWSADTRHEYGNPAMAWDHSWLIATGTALNAALRQWPLPLNEVLRIGAEECCDHYWKCLERELRRPAPDNWVLAAVMELLIYELSHLAQGSLRPLPEGIVRTVNYMRSHLASHLTLTSLAELAGGSVPRFLVVFRDFYRTSPMRYWKELRLEAARRRLEVTEAAVKEIATQCGFDDALHFSREYRNRYGVSPVEWRCRYRAAAKE